MTSNQIAYLNAIYNYQINKLRYEEDQRHNIAMESLQTQQIQQNKELKLKELDNDISKFNANLDETRRANMIRENQNIKSINEQMRHNVRSEDIQTGSLYEQMRHNIATENISMIDTNERIRNNKFVNELSRDQFNWNKEYQNKSLGLSQQQINLGYYQASLQAQKIANDYALGKESNAIKDKQVEYGYSIDQGNLDLSTKKYYVDKSFTTAKTMVENEKIKQETWNTKKQSFETSHRFMQDYVNTSIKLLDAIIPF